LAAVLAASPLEVRVAHEVRPDIPLHSAVLLALMAFRTVGPLVRGDVWSGAAIGAATAIKFSGALVAPAYVLRRLLVPGPKLRRLALAGVVSLCCFALLSPYTFLRGQSSIQGMDDQLSFHYEERPADAGLLGTAVAYAGILLRALGAPALLLASAGLFLGRREWREQLPLLALPVLTIAVFSTATITQDRFLVPALGAALLLAGPAIERLVAWSRSAFAATAVVAVAIPLLSSVDYVRAILRPTTKDDAADWIETHLSGGRVVTSVNAAIGLDPRRFETLLVGRLDATTRLQAVHADVVVTGPGLEREVLAGLTKLFVAEPQTPYSGERIRVYGVPRDLRPRYARVSLGDARIEASENAAGVAAMIDGDARTAWRTATPQAPGAWIEITLPEPVLLGRIELVPPPDADEAADELEAYATEGPPRLGRMPTLPGRPGIAAQLTGAQVSQVLLVPEARVLTLRLAQVGRKATSWGIAELRLDALVETSP
jgi:hypothetical protein